MVCEKSKILVFGATGYLGKYMVKASASMGHPTYAYVRPLHPDSAPSKLQLHQEFESMGVTIFQVLLPFFLFPFSHYFSASIIPSV